MELPFVCTGYNTIAQPQQASWHYHLKVPIVGLINQHHWLLEHVSTVDEYQHLSRNLTDL